MKKNTGNLFLFISMICIARPVLADDALKSIDITIGEWKPYISQSLEGYGELTREITLTLERMGYRPNYQFMPWGQAEKLVRNNANDSGPRGTFPFSQVGDRIGNFYFSKKPVLTKCTVFFYNKDKLKDRHISKVMLGSLQDLDKDNYRLGYIKKTAGYQYPKQLQKILEKQGTAVDSDYILFKKLIDDNDKKIEMVPEVREVGQVRLLESFPNEREKIAVFPKNPDAQHCLVPVKYYFMISALNPNNSEFMDKFDKQYQELLDTGAIDQIKQNAERQPTLDQPAVILTTNSPEGLIKAHDANKEYFLPRGTRGLLKDWKPDRGKTAVQARIYILSYPYRGHELFVDGRYVELQ